MQNKKFELAFESAFVILMVLSFYLLFFLDWNGLQRGAVLIAYIVLMAIFYKKITLAADFPLFFKKIAYSLVIAAILLNIGYNLWYFQDFSSEKYIYEGRATVLSSEYFFKQGMNPYSQKVDLSGEIAPFDGYKYMPFMFLMHAPFTLFFGKLGVLIVNLLVYAGILIVAYFLIKKLYGADSYYPAKFALLFLLCYVVTYEVFYRGVNDLIPAFFVLCSITLFFYRKYNWAGVLLGLSIATKPFPGVFLFLLFLLDKRFRIVLFSLITGGGFILPFIIWDWWSFFLNIIYFNVLRQANPSSIYYFMPGFLQSVWLWLLVLILGYLLYKWIVSKKRRIDLLYYFTLLSTVFLLMNKVTHRNYLVWALPFILLILSKRIDILEYFIKSE